MKKFIFALALLVCANSVSLVASDISDAKNNLKSAQKELSSVTSKRDKAQQKQNQLQADYEEAVAKVAANQDKPKSLAYKNAVKKSEELTGKAEQNAQLLASLNRQVDSLQNVVAGCETALSQAQQAEEAEREEASVEEPVVEPIIEQPVEREEKRDAIVLQEDNKTSDASADKDDTPAKPKTFWQKVWSVIKIIFWIIIGIIVLRILVKIGGRSSSHSGSSGKSASQRDKDEKKRWIAIYQRDIEKLKVQMERSKANYRRTGSSAERKMIDRYKIQIQELRHKISQLK